MIHVSTLLAFACLVQDPTPGQQEPSAPKNQQPIQAPPGAAEHRSSQGGQGAGQRSAAEWIEQLGSDTFKSRLEAERALRGMGKDALPALREAAKNDQEPEAKWRAERLLRQIERGESGGLGRRDQQDQDPNAAERPGRFRLFTPMHGMDGDVQRRFDRLFADLERDFGMDIARGRFFNDGFFHDLQQQIDEMQQEQGGTMGKGQSMSMQIGPDGVRVEVKRKGDSGKEDVQVYEAPDMETFQQKYPGVLEQNGLGGGMSLFFDDGGGRAQQLPRWGRFRQFDDMPLRALQPFDQTNPPSTEDPAIDLPAQVLPPEGRRLGVVVRPQISPDVRDFLGLQDDEGLQVAEVQADTLAERLGLEAGDIVLRIGDHKIGATQDVQAALGAIPSGQKVEVKVVRRGKDLTLSADKPASKEPAQAQPESSEPIRLERRQGGAGAIR